MRLKKVTIFPTGISRSCMFASQFLIDSGYTITDHFSPEITHLLLDIPSFDECGHLKDGSDLQDLLNKLPESVTVIGGNLAHTSLLQHQTIDLLADPVYLAKNAAITAECVLQVAADYLDTTFADTQVLILGWGRIGKCLSKLLNAMDSKVTVAARKESDRAMAEALGCSSLDFCDVPGKLSDYQILFNTVPHQTIDSTILNRHSNCIKLDLASAPGMICDDIIIARGLPGKYAPKTSGKLIADTIRKALKEVTL